MSINQVMSSQLHSDAVCERGGEVEKLPGNVIFLRGKYSRIVLNDTSIIYFFSPLLCLDTAE